MEEESDLSDGEKELLGEIRARRSKLVSDHRRKKSAANNTPVMPRTVDPERKQTTKNMKASLERMGIDAGAAVERARERSQSRYGRKRGRSASAGAGGDDVDMGSEGEGGAVKKAREFHSSKSRSQSVARRVGEDVEDSPGKGLKNKEAKMRGQKLADKAQKKRNRMAKAGEGDRAIQTKMPKHLFSGKRGIGETDRR